MIEDLNEGCTYEFPCNQWLAKDEGDKQTYRYLYPKQTVAHNRKQGISRSKINVCFFL